MSRPRTIDLDDPDVNTILTDAIWRAHVAGTPEEFHEGLGDGMKHTSDVCRIAAAYILEQLDAWAQEADGGSA